MGDCDTRPVLKRGTREHVRLAVTLMAVVVAGVLVRRWVFGPHPEGVARYVYLALPVVYLVVLWFVSRRQA